MLQQRIRGIIKAIKRHGVLNYIQRLFHRIWQTIYKKQVSTVFRRDLSEEVELLDAKIPVEIRVYESVDKKILYKFLSQFVREDLIDKTLDQGMIPMLGFVNDKLIALSWFTTDSVYLESLDLTLKYGNNTGFIEGSRTDESVRGKSIAPAIRTRICKHLRDMGMRQVFVVAGDDNLASQAVARKCLFKPYESITMRRILGFHSYHRKKY